MKFKILKPYKEQTISEKILVDCLLTNKKNYLIIRDFYHPYYVGAMFSTLIHLNIVECGVHIKEYGISKTKTKRFGRVKTIEETETEIIIRLVKEYLLNNKIIEVV